MHNDPLTRVPQLHESDEEDIIESAASVFHEQWREGRKLGDGTYCPRIKKTTDIAWIAAHGSDVDIANTRFRDLPVDWQYENRRAAEAAASTYRETGYSAETALNDSTAYQEVGSSIHDAWLQRNPWASNDPELGVPFDRLSLKEQLKDVSQYVEFARLAELVLGKSEEATP